MRSFILRSKLFFAKKTLYYTFFKNLFARVVFWPYSLTHCDLHEMPKRYKNADEYPGDRMTVTVHRGYKQWFRKVAIERNTDVSKAHREALDMWIKANYHTLSDKARKELDALRKAHSDSRWSDLL